MKTYSPTNQDLQNLKGLKPITCKSCQADGCYDAGQCEQCLKNQAYNKELVETSLFIVDDKFENYHSNYSGHPMFKTMPLHEKGEKPYLYYGVEIEVEFDDSYLEVLTDEYYDDEQEPTDSITEILAEFSKITNGLFIYEKDGSLQNGVELISRPMSYAKWTSEEIVEKMKKGFEYLKEHGALVEQPKTNGLHIHISKKFFDYGETTRENRDWAYRDMNWLFQYYQPEIEKLGAREYTHYCASIVQKIKEQYGNNRVNNSFYNAEFTVKGKVKKGGQIPMNDHYSAVNSTRATVEARVFKSTIDYKRVLAYIELVRNFAHAVRNGEISGKTLNQILNTKDNLYLDGLVREVRNECHKKKSEFSLARKNTDEIEF